MQKIGIFGLVLLKHEKKSWINKKIDYIIDMYSDRPLIACPYFSLILTLRYLKKTIAKASKTVS